MSEALHIEFEGMVSRKSTLADKGTSVTFHLPQGCIEASALLEMAFQQNVRLRIVVDEIDREDAPAEAEPQAPRVRRWNDKH